MKKSITKKFNKTFIKKKKARTMSDQIGKSRFVSADRLRQIRMDDADILRHHYKGPHINFDILKPNPIRPNKMIVIDKIHMLLK